MVSLQKENTKETTTKKSKETKNMKKTEVKAAETKVEEVKVVEEVKNEEKKNQYIDIQEMMKLWEEAGIQVNNPNLKGNYRIMGSAKKGTSIHINSREGYICRVTEEDYNNLVEAKIDKEDLQLLNMDNAVDHCRPHTVKCSELDTLKRILAVYAQNVFNKKVQATA